MESYGISKKQWLEKFLALPHFLISNLTKLITQKSGLKCLTGKELVNNRYVINSVQVLSNTT
jgi:hypothetical protein